MPTRFIFRAAMGCRLGANTLRFLSLLVGLFLVVAPSICWGQRPAKPDRLYILIDRSESMGMDPERQTRLPADIGFQRTRIGAAFALAKRRAESAVAAGEQVHLITFSDASYRNGHSGPTFFGACSNLEQLDAVFDEAQKQAPGGRTHLWDTICDVLNRAGNASSEFGRLSIAVYTDGKDEGSTRTPNEIQRLMNVVDRRGTAFKYVEVWSYEGSKVLDTEVPSPPPPPPPPVPPAPPAPTLRVSRTEPLRRVYSSEELKEGFRLGLSVRIQGEHHTKDAVIEVSVATKGGVVAKLDRGSLRLTPKNGVIDESKTIDVSIGGQGQFAPGPAEVILTWRTAESAKEDEKVIGAPIRLSVTDAPSLIAVGIAGDLGSNTNRIYRGDRKQFQLKLTGNPESSGQWVEVALPAVPGISIDNADGAWESLGDGRLRRRMPETARGDDDVPVEKPNPPEMELKLVMAADPTLAEGSQSLIIALDLKGSRQPWSQSINVSPQVATFELIGDLRSGIHEQPPGGPAACGQRITVGSNNSLAAKMERLVIDGVGIPKGITVLLKDASGVERRLPVDIVGDNATFDVLLGWDATSLRKEELASLTQNMKLQLRPAPGSGAKIAAERSHVDLPQLAFEPIVRATIDGDWGFESPKSVAPSTSNEIRLRLDANGLALAAKPQVVLEIEGGTIAGIVPRKPIALQQATTEFVITTPPIAPGGEHLVKIVVAATFAGVSKVPVGEFRRRLVAGKVVVESRITVAPELVVFPGDWVRVGSVQLSNLGKSDVAVRLTGDASQGTQVRIIAGDDALALAPAQTKIVTPGTVAFPIEMMFDGRSKGAETKATAKLDVAVVDERVAVLNGQSNAQFRLAPRKVAFTIFRGTNSKGVPRTIWAGDDMISAEDEAGVLTTKPPSDRRSGLVGKLGDLPEELRSKAGALRLRVVLSSPPKGKSWKNPSIRPVWRVNGQDVATLEQLQKDAGITFNATGRCQTETLSVDFEPLDGFDVQPGRGKVLLKPSGGGFMLLWILLALLGAVIGAWAYFRRTPKRLARRVYMISPDGKKTEELILNEYGPSSLHLNVISGEVAAHRDAPHESRVMDDTEVWVVVPLKDGIRLEVPKQSPHRINVDEREWQRTSSLQPKDGEVVALLNARFVTVRPDQSCLGMTFARVGDPR